ncbi:MAG TPA: hypothetical protein QF353_05940 [Gammaproteobacteria bacterium]|nr:hypothetical protein [Gammaproteobacteria bacterium]
MLWILLVLLYGCDYQFHNSLGYSEAEWSNFSNSQKNKLIAEGRHVKRSNDKITLGTHESVTVSFIKGQAKMNNNKIEYFKRADIFLNNGGCGQVKLKSSVSSRYSPISVCFKGNMVLIDSSWSGVSGFDLRLFKNSMWYRGMNYSNINSKGTTALNNSLISIVLHTA